MGFAVRLLRLSSCRRNGSGLRPVDRPAGGWRGALRRGAFTASTLVRTRRPWWALTLVALLGFGSVRAGERHLFLDPGFLTDVREAALTVNPASRREVVIRADRPWEKHLISFFLTVRDEGGKLRMWYICRDDWGEGQQIL